MELYVSKYRLIMRISLYVTTGILFLMMGCQGAVPSDTLAKETIEENQVAGSLEPTTGVEAFGQTPPVQDSENDSKFHDHGMAVPISALRGGVAVKDQGKGPCVLAWLQDNSGCSSLLSINTRTAESKQIPTPVSSEGDAPFASLLSRDNRFYTYFNSHLFEFDSLSETFTFAGKAGPKTAMSLTEDDQGRIWIATYPNCSLISYNPETRIMKDYGPIHTESWDQYPYYIAADDAGWVYVALGYAGTQIVAFNPATGKSHTVLPESERQNGMAYLYRDHDGKVYGRPLEDSPAATKARKPVAGSSDWYELYQGKHRKMGILAQPNPRPIGSGRRDLYIPDLGDGTTVKDLDLQTRTLTIYHANGLFHKTIPFSYQSEGAYILSVVTAPGGLIAGGSFFPHCAFLYNPMSDSYVRHISYDQWNTLVRHDSRVYVGTYPKGKLLEWVPGTEWNVDSTFTGPGVFRQCASADSTLKRPHDLVVDQNGQNVILAGTPEYGMTGGGLLIWNIGNNTSEQLDDTRVIPHQSVRSLVVLRDGTLLGGTTSSAGTGGLKTTDEATLFIMDLESRKILWSAAILPGVQDYSDLAVSPDGLVYGLADRSVFFVFNPVTRTIVKLDDSKRHGTVNWQQGQRAFVTADDGRCYLLFTEGIAMVDGEKGIQWVETSPVPITSGGDFLNGRIYFASGSRLYSYRISEKH